MKSLKVLVAAALVSILMFAMVSCGLKPIEPQDMIGSKWIEGKWEISEVSSFNDESETWSFVIDVKGNAEDSDVVYTVSDSTYTLTLKDFVREVENYKNINILSKESVEAQIAAFAEDGVTVAYEGDYSLMSNLKDSVTFTRTLKNKTENGEDSATEKFIMKKVTK